MVDSTVTPPGGEGASGRGGEIPGFQIIKVLGVGGMAVVYLAVQKSLNRYVALKILRKELSSRPAFVAAFAHDASVLATLNHPNIVPIYDQGVVDGQCYLAMEYVEGDSLQSAIASRKLSYPDYLGVIRNVCAAVAYIHSRGILHLDLKPANILVNKNGQVKVTDFGVAQIGKESTQQVEAPSGGTLHFTAPEVLAGKYYDLRADVFSLGVIFYEMMTGCIPDGSTRASTLNPAIPKGADIVLQQCISPDPEARYPNAEVVAHELLAAMTGTPKPAWAAASASRAADLPADPEARANTGPGAAMPSPAPSPPLSGQPSPPPVQQPSPPPFMPPTPQAGGKSKQGQSRTILVTVLIVLVALVSGAAIMYFLRGGAPPSRTASNTLTTNAETISNPAKLPVLGPGQITKSMASQTVRIAGRVSGYRAPWKERAPHVITLEKSGAKIDIVFWSEVEKGLGPQMAMMIQSGSLIEAIGVVNDFRGSLQLQINQAEDLTLLEQGSGALAAPAADTAASVADAALSLANPASTPPPSAMAEAVSAASAARVLESALPALGETTLSTPRPVPLAAMRPDSGPSPSSAPEQNARPLSDPENSPSWVYRGQLAIAPYAYSFLAVDSNDVLYAATFNTTSAGTEQAEMPVFRITNPLSPKPDVAVVAKSSLPPMRGYGGICCDAWRNVYISKDTGERAGSCVFSYTADGAPNTDWSPDGCVKPGRRCLGVAVIGETLLLAVDWGEVLAINIKNGDQRMPLLKAPSTFHVRDLCADDKGLAVVGIAGGQIVGWSRSKLGDWQNWGFWTWEKLTPTDNAVQGVAYDANRRSILAITSVENKVSIMDERMQITHLEIPQKAGVSRLGDAVISASGDTLYLSDLMKRCIFVFRRASPGANPSSPQ